MRTTTLVPVIIALAMLAGCEDDRSSGVILTSDGHVLSNSAEHNRELAVSRIDESLAKRTGAHWRARTTIAQLPQWDEGRDSEPEWRWDQCDVAIEIIGDGQTTLPIAPDEVRTGVYDYMRPKVDHPARNLKVSVAVENDPARFAALGAAEQPPGAPITYATAPPPSAPGSAAPGSVPAPAAPPSYIIQAGDTWAALSTAFYGSPALWRTLAEANHWNNANPRVGEALIVPPAPVTSPAAVTPSVAPTSSEAPAAPAAPAAPEPPPNPPHQ